MLDPARWPLLARELVVPAIMLGGIALYVSDAAQLSAPALILPVALIVVIVAALVWSVAASVLRPGRVAAGEDDGPILKAKPWLLVLLPLPLVALMDMLGALVALVALVLGAQLALGRQAPWRSVAIAVAVAVPTYALFAWFLYVRFPKGLLGIG